MANICLYPFVKILFLSITANGIRGAVKQVVASAKFYAEKTNAADDQDNEAFDKNAKVIVNTVIQITFPAYVVVGLVISSGVFVITIAKDKEDKLRHLLHFAGIQPFSYYLGMFLADMLLFCAPIALLMLMSYFLSIEAFYQNAGMIFLSLMTFGFPFISLIYCSSFFFTKSETAFKYSYIFLWAITLI